MLKRAHHMTMLKANKYIFYGKPMLMINNTIGNGIIYE